MPKFGRGEGGGLAAHGHACYHAWVHAIAGSPISANIDLRLFEEINLAVGSANLLFAGQMDGKFLFTKIGPMRDPGGDIAFVMNSLVDLGNQGIIDTLEDTEIHIQNGSDMLVWNEDFSTYEV